MPKDSIDSFAISLLHELGHIETMKTFNKMSIALDDIKKSIIQTFIDSDFDKKRVIAKTYYSLPTEYTATKWAVDWIRKHPNKYKVMLKRIEKALNNFYKINLYYNKNRKGIKNEIYKRTASKRPYRDFTGNGLFHHQEP